jgi:hypothetical protein
MLEKMVFEKILIEHTLHEASGRDFWIKYFLTQVHLSPPSVFARCVAIHLIIITVNVAV